MYTVQYDKPYTPLTRLGGHSMAYPRTGDVWNRGRNGKSQEEGWSELFFYQLQKLSLVRVISKRMALHPKEGCSGFLSGLTLHVPSWEQDSSFSDSSSFSNGLLLQELHLCRSQQAVTELWHKRFPSPPLPVAAQPVSPWTRCAVACPQCPGWGVGRAY